MVFSKFILFLFLRAALARHICSPSASVSCICAPEDSCWPSANDWNNFNTTVAGKPIATRPVALPCYLGPEYVKEACATVLVGCSHVTNSCSIGSYPRYAVNVTAVKDIAARLAFAQKKNLTVVVKATGHGILGRNDGYGSIEVWLRYFRQGISFQGSFDSSTGSTASHWQGTARKFGCGYMWHDVYAAAKEYNVVVVGGGSPTVSSTGGWMQGGGHGPASHTFGLGADQVLEAEVVLANGTLVTANACQNQDHYFTIRGRGAGTY
ncbi:hypothetical protein EDB80DRAFT_692886 [Ilyonectria destructans]|nr:hypothetical protein EDB80DRAFT_692886 [Ilyonectria destructans]